jgi:hypothetical protein
VGRPLTRLVGRTDCTDVSTRGGRRMSHAHTVRVRDDSRRTLGVNTALARQLSELRLRQQGRYSLVMRIAGDKTLARVRRVCLLAMCLRDVVPASP